MNRKDMKLPALGWLLMAALGPMIRPAVADQVEVRFPEGTTHGLLRVRSLDGKEMGSGDLTETVAGNRVHTILKFQLQDGSLYEEDTEFTQTKVFNLLHYHQIESGPAFKQQLDFQLDAVHGTADVVSSDEHGKQSRYSEKIDVPADLANGIVVFLVRNLNPALNTPTSTKVSMVVTTPKPRLVNLVISPEDVENFPLAGHTLETTRFEIKVDIPGLTGAAAKVTGREPPVSYMWIVEGKAPLFVMAQQELLNGPVCRIELTAPQLP